MGMIKTLENFDFGVGGKHELTVANYPCLDFLFKFEEPVGATSITEFVSGAVFPLSSPITDGGGGVKVCNTAANQAPISGSIARRTGPYHAGLFIGGLVGITANPKSFTIGNSGGERIYGLGTVSVGHTWYLNASIAIAATSAVANSPSNTQSSPAMYIADSSSGLIAIDRSATNAASSSKTPTALGALVWQDIANAITFDEVGGRVLAVFTFDTDPGDRLQGLMWMHQYYLDHGKFQAYPYWLAKS